MKSSSLDARSTSAIKFGLVHHRLAACFALRTIEAGATAVCLFGSRVVGTIIISLSLWFFIATSMFSSSEFGLQSCCFPLDRAWLLCGSAEPLFGLSSLLGRKLVTCVVFNVKSGPLIGLICLSGCVIFNVTVIFSYIH